MASTLRFTPRTKMKISPGLSAVSFFLLHTRGGASIFCFIQHRRQPISAPCAGLQGPIPILAVSTLFESVCEDIHSFLDTLADPWLEGWRSSAILLGTNCISGDSEKEDEEEKRVKKHRFFLVFVREGLFIRRLFLSFLFFFDPEDIGLLCTSLLYTTMSGVVNSEVKSSTAAEAPIEAGNAGDNNNDRPTVHVFNEQTNYVPKRTIITVCIVYPDGSTIPDLYRSSWHVPPSTSSL